MKKLSLIVLSIFCASLFIGFTIDEPVAGHTSLEGVWEMKHQYIYENNEIQDTLFDVDGKRQVKIYSNGKVMWSRYSPKDANDWFGYGSYKIVDGFLEERLEFAVSQGVPRTKIIIDPGIGLAKHKITILLF